MKKKSLLMLFILLLVGLSFSIERDSQYLKNQEMLKKGFSFNLTFEQAKTIIQRNYPNLKTDAEVLQFIEEKKIQKYEKNGETLYFDDMETNLCHRDFELSQRTEGWNQHYEGIIKTSLSPYLHKEMNTQSINSPYFNPRKYLVDYSINVDKENLPDKGQIKLWIPLPLKTGCQEGFKLIKVEPSDAVVGYPKTNGDIAYILLDIQRTPDKDLDTSLLYTYTHYQQGFNVDLEVVGEYDLNSDLYKRYTKSSNDIFYNEEMRKLAQGIVEDETNPYLMAKKIYDYIIKNIDYSLMAHAFLESEDIPESFYVFEHGYGDCGAQAMFFSALCRSLGIPARTTGGFQLFMNELGSHFWAEFYLPNYGWVPVDTSVGSVAQYAYWMSEEEKENFTAFFFGNQDPLRMVVQKDVNIAPDVVPEDVQILSMVLQLPYIDVDYSNENFAVSLEIVENRHTKVYAIQ